MKDKAKQQSRERQRKRRKWRLELISWSGLAWFPFHRCRLRIPVVRTWKDLIGQSATLCRWAVTVRGEARQPESHSNNNLAYLRLWINDTTTQFLGLSRDLIRVYVLGGYYLCLRPLRALFLARLLLTSHFSDSPLCIPDAWSRQNNVVNQLCVACLGLSLYGVVELSDT